MRKDGDLTLLCLLGKNDLKKYVSRWQNSESRSSIQKVLSLGNTNSRCRPKLSEVQMEIK